MATEPRNRSERRRQRRKQRLIEAARLVLANKGVAGLTVLEVTDTADVAVGSFYTYFADKEELLEAAIWEDLQKLGDPAAPELQTLPPLERARILLTQTYAFVEDHRDLMRAVFGPGHTAAQYERGLQLIDDRVTHGLQATAVPAQDIPWLAALLAGMIAGGIRFALKHPSVTAAEMTERTLRLLRPLQDLGS